MSFPAGSGDNAAAKFDGGSARLAPRPVAILRDDVVNQIAAGEVVERPSSVVKELVENSIDAGATEITVIADNGGTTNIEIVDDGSGMSPEDAAIAIRRFGTSKIREASDLESIGSLGFRGEALPSIASISRFRLRTKTHPNAPGAIAGSSICGTDIVIEGGAEPIISSCEMVPGTRIQVRQLFFNVPARRKFLRAERTEAAQIRAVITDFSLVYPHIRFRLVLDGVEAAVFHPAPDFYGRAALLKLGAPEPFSIDRVFASQASPVPLRIGAVLSKPIAAASTADRLRLFVNGRLVRDKLLMRAVRDGYGNFLKPGTYPAGALVLSIADTEVDVNVHPQKSEVRFRSPQSVFGAVSGAVRSALRDQLPAENRLGAGSAGADQIAAQAGGEASVVQAASGSSQHFGVPDNYFNRGSLHYSKQRGADQMLVQPALFSGTGRIEASAFGEAESTIAGANCPNNAPTVSAGADFPGVPKPVLDPSSYRFIGQLFELYLILEGPAGMLLVDMHAAHERVMYVKIKERLLTGTLPSQLLLAPEIVHVAPGEPERFERWRPALSELGIEIEPFGESAVAVRSLPSLLKNSSPERLVQELAAIPEWSDLPGEVSGPREEVMRRLEAAIARLACHRSVRSGRILERDEVYALLEELNQVEGSAFCPHGRPVLRFVTPSEFERIFGR